MGVIQVNGAAGTYDHRCEACGHQVAGRPVAGVQSQQMPFGSALSVVCGSCGAVECFNTALTAADEDPATAGNTAARAQQARLVRLLCAMVFGRGL
jgi:hypothetical protein